MAKMSMKSPTSKRYKKKTDLKKKPCVVSKCVKKYVKKALKTTLENKEYVITGINNALSTASASAPAAINCVPDTIAQGVAHNQRIGNEISCVKGIIRIWINYLPYNIATNPQSAPLWIKLWLVSAKKINTNSIGSTSITSDFFDLGGSSGTFSGNMRDLLTPVNKDAWTVLSTKTQKIGFSNGNTGGSPVTNATWYDNSPFSVNFTFNYGKHLKTKLKYNDTTTVVTNRNMFLVMQAVYADGTNSAITPAEYHYSNVFEYEDA